MIKGKFILNNNSRIPFHLKNMGLMKGSSVAFAKIPGGPGIILSANLYFKIY